jgi:hypothetical protein
LFGEQGNHALKKTERITERLRAGFASLDENETAEGESCPSAERIWDGAHGRLTPEEALAVGLHLAECPSCATDWRTAMRSTERVASTASTIAAYRPAPRRAWIGVAAAAVVIVGLLAVFQATGVFRWTESPYRAPEGDGIRSLLPDEAVLPRDDAVLRWTDVGEGARYSVEIGLTDLTPLAAVHDLSETEYRIPPVALETVEAGGIVAWQVEAQLPDGSRVVSRAFLVKIE